MSELLDELAKKAKDERDIQIRATKSLRQEADTVLQGVKELEPSREVSISITNMQQSIMWLGMNLKRLGTPNPYPESKNPGNTRIEPTADGLKL